MSRVGELRYPDAPGFKRAGGTSEQAAEVFKGSAAKLRVRVLAEFARHPISGATAELGLIDNEADAAQAINTEHKKSGALQ
jgi:hypothetical protein